MRWLIACVGLFLCLGCSHYEYDLVQPPDMAGHIGTKADLISKREPLEYRFISLEDRLVVRVYNPTDTQVNLLGGSSSVIDPSGQSHPLRSQAIPPGSFVKVILPPIRPQLGPSGPTLGIGIGVAGGRFHRGFAESEIIDEPRYYTLYDEGDTTYWTWDGETNVRLILSYQRNEKNFSDTFELHRKKM